MQVAQQEDLSQATTRELAEEIENLRQAREIADTQIAKRMGELLSRLHRNGGTALMDEDFEIKLERQSGGFDPQRLAPLKEMLPENELSKAWTPEHEETVTVAEKWDGRTLLSLAHRYGGDVSRIVFESRLEGRERLVVERRS